MTKKTQKTKQKRNKKGLNGFIMLLMNAFKNIEQKEVNFIQNITYDLNTIQGKFIFFFMGKLGKKWVKSG